LRPKIETFDATNLLKDSNQRGESWYYKLSWAKDGSDDRRKCILESENMLISVTVTLFLWVPFRWNIDSKELSPLWVWKISILISKNKVENIISLNLMMMVSEKKYKKKWEKLFWDRILEGIKNMKNEGVMRFNRLSIFTKEQQNYRYSSCQKIAVWCQWTNVKKILEFFTFFLYD
jgi:hypothetical protein